MIDRELVTRKLALIIEDLPALKELAGKSLDEYLANPVHYQSGTLSGSSAG